MASSEYKHQKPHYNNKLSDTIDYTNNLTKDKKNLQKLRISRILHATTYTQKLTSELNNH